MLDELDEIGARGTVRNVAAIAVLYGMPNGWANAARALEQVLSRARMRDLVWLEANARSVLGSSAYYGSPWGGLDPSDLLRLPAAVQRLATFHANGRVREAAVSALASSDDPRVVPYLLLRANDWVPQVSERACAALEDRLRPDNASAWVAALPIEHHVRALGRRALGYLFDAARAILVAPEARSALCDALQSGTTDVRRACASLVLSLPSDERAPFLAVAVCDRDPLVASSAAAALLERCSDDEIPEIAVGLLGHRVARVRALALMALWTRFPSKAFDLSRASVFDTARCVREVAQFELRRRRAIDAAAIYVSALTTARGRELLVMLAGLTECGSAQHAELVARFVADRSPRVQCAAIRALARLDGDAYTLAFVNALQSASPRVARTGREALDKRAHLVERATLDAILEAGGAPARAVIALLPQLEYWGALLAALRAVAAPDVRDVALRAIERLVARRTYSFPADHAALESAFAAVRADIPNAKRVEDLLELTSPRLRR